MKLSLKMNVTATSIEAADVGRYSSQTFQRHNGENHARGMLKMIFWCFATIFLGQIVSIYYFSEREKVLCAKRLYYR